MKNQNHESHMAISRPVGWRGSFGQRWVLAWVIAGAVAMLSGCISVHKEVERPVVVPVQTPPPPAAP